MQKKTGIASKLRDTGFYVILFLRPFSIPLTAERRRYPMEAFISFIQTVGAEVVAYYLCKWLDSLFFKGSKH